MEPVVQVEQGKLRGTLETSVNKKKFIAFRGIPYAKPPIGPLRFKDCEPVEKWSGTRDATKFGSACAQEDFVTKEILGSDDCLYLNIYTATLNSHVMPNRAVMVWIHGGAFVNGCGDDKRWGPDNLIEKDVVLVTINYRLGMLGFLNIGDIESPGNQGLKDQVQALKWIQKNILNFGGDSKNITIFGQSSGGASVHYLTISPLAEGLFHKAIIQSGVAINPWASSLYSPEILIQRLSKIFGKDYSSKPKEIVNYLRTLSTQELIKIQRQLNSEEDIKTLIGAILPSTDIKAEKPFLPMSVDEAVKMGIKVPCICGYVSHEGLFIAAYWNEKKLHAIDDNLDILMKHPNIQIFLREKNITSCDLKNYYINEKISTKNIDKIMELFGILYFIIGIHKILEIQMNTPTVANIPMYLYKFEYEMENSLVKKLWKINLRGTSHSDELELLFHPKLLGRKPAAQDSTEYNLIQRFTELWSSFAKTGKPICQTTQLTPVLWQPVDQSIQYNCLHITKDLNTITEINILHKLAEKIKEKQ